MPRASPPTSTSGWVTCVRTCEIWRTSLVGRKCSVTVLICCCISQTPDSLPLSGAGVTPKKRKPFLSWNPTPHLTRDQRLLPEWGDIPVPGDQIHPCVTHSVGTVPRGRPPCREMGSPGQKEDTGRSHAHGRTHAPSTPGKPRKTEAVRRQRKEADPVDSNIAAAKGTKAAQMWRGADRPVSQGLQAQRQPRAHQRISRGFGAHGCGLGGSMMLLNIWSTLRKKPSRIRPTNLPEPCTCGIKALLQTERKGRVACCPGRAGIRAHGALCPQWGGGPCARASFDWQPPQAGQFRGALPASRGSASCPPSAHSRGQCYGKVRGWSPGFPA